MRGAGALTVVIPTFNRASVLRKALDAYREQTDLESILELIVVDDGSADETEQVVRDAAIRSRMLIRYMRQENSGPAAARNIGIREARGEIILFTDDDIIPTPTLVAEHVSFHSLHPDAGVAVLGCVTWAPEVNATPFMEWYGADGALFAYAHFADKKQLTYTDFYTCNLSLKTDFLRRNGIFDQDFKIAAYEDIELGYRLERRGMKLLYHRAALAHHLQHISFENACCRLQKAREALETFKEKEAGKYYNQQRSSKAPGGPAEQWSVKRAVLRLARLALSPCKKAMDSQTPLPWIVYRLMFRIFHGDLRGAGSE